MAQTAAHLVDHVIPHVPVRQWVLSLPIPLRLLLAAQPKLVKPVLQVVHRVITRHLLGQGLGSGQTTRGNPETAPGKTLFSWAVNTQRISACIQRQIEAHRAPCTAVFRVPWGREKSV